MEIIKEKMKIIKEEMEIKGKKKETKRKKKEESEEIEESEEENEEESEEEEENEEEIENIDQIFEKKTKIKKEIKKEKQEEEEKEEIENIDQILKNNEKKEYRCEICESINNKIKLYSTAESYNKHLRKYHRDKKEITRKENIIDNTIDLTNPIDNSKNEKEILKKKAIMKERQTIIKKLTENSIKFNYKEPIEKLRTKYYTPIYQKASKPIMTLFYAISEFVEDKLPNKVTVNDELISFKGLSKNLEDSNSLIEPLVIESMSTIKALDPIVDKLNTISPLVGLASTVGVISWGTYQINKNNYKLNKQK